MKKKLLIILAFMSSVVAWAHDVEIDGIYYNLDTTNKVATVTYRGDYASSYKGEYLGEITIPSELNYNSEKYKVELISKSAFEGCEGITTINLPNSIISIGQFAFSGCAELTSIIIPDKVSIIESFTFYNCKNLHTITIGAGIKEINNTAFQLCGNLTNILWKVATMEDFLYAHNTPFYGIKSQITSFVFGENVEHIPAYLCKGMVNLQELTIPRNVKSIGEDAFYGNTSLKSVTISSVELSVKNFAFQGCTSLSKVNYLGDVNNWAQFTFSNAYANPITNSKNLYVNNTLLTTLRITSAESINAYTFVNCHSLETLIANNVNTIGGTAFGNCYGLRSVTLGKALTTIWSLAFESCTKLNYVNFLGNIDEWTDIYFGSLTANPVYYSRRLYLSSELLKNVKLSCKNLGAYAFAGCESIENVEILEDIERLGNQAFYECDGIGVVKSHSIEVPAMGNDVFTGVSDEIQLYVPCSSVENYKLDDTFGRFKNINCFNPEEEPTDVLDIYSNPNISVENGLISSEDLDFRIFNTAGQDVTSQNGNLSSGVYIVATDKTVTKVMMQ